MLAEVTSKAEELTQALEGVIAGTPFASLMGAKILSVTPGTVELAIAIKPEIMAQHHGFVHGAVLGFMADSACTWAAGTLAGDVVTSEYKIHFLTPAVGGRLIARGRVIKAGSRTLVSQADVYCVRNGNERLVAVAMATIAKVERNGGNGK